MATEPTSEKTIDTHVLSASQLTTGAETESRSQNVDSSQSMVNGDAAVDDIENKRVTYLDDRIHSVEGSVSGGSDTDASRTKDGRGHSRTSSAKKPATFKSVSVNKTFLAAKGAASPALSKVGDKGAAMATLTAQPSTSALSATRPRLIAKTGTGSRDSIPKFAVNGTRVATAPDPNAVWNKNRPTPTPDPKKLTDEELKKYGIHMATRLHSEDIQGQSNWADIDDDDDDWAPETVTWADGTKTTLPQADEVPPMAAVAAADPTPAAASVSVLKDKSLFDKPRSPAPAATSSPSIKPTGLASGKGLILKSGLTDKVTLVAKPPAPPAPTKSPWAPLPPIDKASPIAPDPSQQHLPGSRLAARDGMPPVKAAAPGPMLVREIAPDDFSRSSWRDSPTMASRELYNSQSGRYEPVGDRRSSFRAAPEAHGRPPAVLQRPHHNEHAPEPSPSFQTSRQGPEGALGRRRGSSNVSGGSGYLQRMGKGYDQVPAMAPPELLGPRRESLTGSADSPISPRNYSPSGQHGGRPQGGHGWPPRSSPAMAHAAPNVAPHVTPHVAPHIAPHTAPHTAPHHATGAPESRPQAGPNAPSEELAVEYQKRLMREKAEEAMKRRLEEEQKEEVAKQERIRLKLAAMGPAPERRSARKETTGKDDAGALSPSGHAETDSGGHAPDTVAPSSGVSTAANRDAAGDGSSGTVPQADASAAGRSGDVQQANPWDASITATANSQDRFPPWPTSGQQPQRNVWASPNNDRGLGNGTFNPDLGRVPDSQAAALSQTSTKSPSPIAPPSQIRSGGRGQAPPMTAPVTAPIRATTATQSYTQSRADGYPPVSTPRTYGSETSNRWVNAVIENDKVMRDQQLKDRAELDRRLAEQGMTYEQAQPTIKHTWRQERTVQLEPRPKGTRVDGSTSKESGGPAANGTAGRPGAAAVPPKAGPALVSNTAGVGPGPSGPSILAPSGAVTSSQPRPSRFFPSSKDGHPCAPLQADQDRSPSPPPPTMAGHPAYDGDVSHPHVSLPRPQPIVKLPPAPAPPPVGPASTSTSASAVKQVDQSFAWAQPVPYKAASSGLSPTSGMVGATGHPNQVLGHGVQATGHHTSHQGTHPNSTTHSQQEWQEKIYELTGRRGGPPKSPVVESASRHALDYSVRPIPATVSLPGILEAKDSRDVTSKPMADECFEEQEMGSLPPVQIPHKAPEAGWQPAMPPKPLHKRFHTEPASVDLPDVTPPGSSVCVYLPSVGYREPKTLSLAKTPRGPYRASVQTRANSRARGTRGGFREVKRDVSNTFPNDATNNAAGPAPPATRGRGAYRGRPSLSSSDWSRRPQQPSAV